MNHINDCLERYRRANVDVLGRMADIDAKRRLGEPVHLDVRQLVKARAWVREVESTIIGQR
jgi:hypothetical protein